MDIDWIHRRDGGQGTLNLCFNALDRHVVHGRADDVALREGTTTWSYARLLEEVAAFGGVLRAFGVGPGDRVGSGVAGRDGLVVLLAALRVGAVLVVDDSAGVRLPGGHVVRREAGVHEAGDGLDWDVLLRAGRTDPAACAEVALDSPAVVLGDRAVSTGELLADGSGWPYDALATLFAGGTVTMGA